MYEVLDKDTIYPGFLPHLSVAKRGYALKKEQTHKLVKEE